MIRIDVNQQDLVAWLGRAKRRTADGLRREAAIALNEAGDLLANEFAQNIAAETGIDAVTARQLIHTTPAAPDHLEYRLDTSFAGRGAIGAEDSERVRAWRASQQTTFKTRANYQFAKGGMVKWITAGDHLVCPKCEELDGEVMTIEEARALHPAHPNCRCAVMPIRFAPSPTMKTGTTTSLGAPMAKGREETAALLMLLERLRKATAVSLRAV